MPEPDEVQKLAERFKVSPDFVKVVLGRKLCQPRR